MAEETQTQPSPPETERRGSSLSDRDLKWKEFHSRNPRLRMFIIVGVVVLLVAGFFLWRYFNSYQSTDDAQIDGHLNSRSYKSIRGTTRYLSHARKLTMTMQLPQRRLQA